MTRSLFLSQITSFGPIAYLIIFVLMMIEGDAIIFISFFLISIRVLDFPMAVLAIFSGAIIGDILWYYIGHTSQPKNKFSLWLLNFSSKLTSKFDNHLKDRTPHSIFISKFTYGLYHLLLLRAGIIHIDFKKIIKADTFVTVIWIIIIGGLGYISGISFDLIKHKLEYIEIGILISVLLFILIGELVSKILEKKI